jgi:hypothetical protein
VPSAESLKPQPPDGSNGGGHELGKADLLKLYELSLLEYRFQVLLNWDRSKQMLVIDGVLLAAAAAIYRLDPIGTPAIVGVLFALVSLTSLLGIAGTQRGHAYYRATRETKAKYEQKLGLDKLGLALETTAGMKETHRPEEAPLSRRLQFWSWIGKLTVHLQFLFLAAAGAGIAGAVIVFTR